MDNCCSGEQFSLHLFCGQEYYFCDSAASMWAHFSCRAWFVLLGLPLIRLYSNWLKSDVVPSLDCLGFFPLFHYDHSTFQHYHRFIKTVVNKNTELFCCYNKTSIYVVNIELKVKIDLDIDFK